MNHIVNIEVRNVHDNLIKKIPVRTFYKTVATIYVYDNLTDVIAYTVNGHRHSGINDWGKELGIFDTDEFTMLKLEYG